MGRQLISGHDSDVSHVVLICFDIRHACFSNCGVQSNLIERKVNRMMIVLKSNLQSITQPLKYYEEIS